MCACSGRSRTSTCLQRFRRRQNNRRAGSHQGNRCERRAAVPGCHHRAGRGAWRAARSRRCHSVIGGRYGLSSKEFTPAMVKAIYEELEKSEPKNHFTIGINDDVTHTSLEFDPSFQIEGRRRHARAVFRHGCRRHGRREQEQHQDHWREHRPALPGLLRL